MSVNRIKNTTYSMDGGSPFLKDQYVETSLHPYLPATDQFQIHSHGPEFYRINSRFESQSIKPGKASYKLQDVARLKDDILLVNFRKAQKVLFVRIVER